MARTTTMTIMTAATGPPICLPPMKTTLLQDENDDHPADSPVRRTALSLVVVVEDLGEVGIVPRLVLFTKFADLHELGVAIEPGDADPLVVPPDQSRLIDAVNQRVGFGLRLHKEAAVPHELLG